MIQQKTRKIFLSVSLVIMVFLGGTATVIAGSTVYTASSEESFCFSILGAFYADLDGDGIEDDIWIKGQTVINTNNEGAHKYDLYVDIIDPVGTVYSGLFYVITKENVHEYFIYAYNTVNEPGWYTVNFEGVVYGSGEIYYSTSSYEFDPPTKSGSGSPSMVMI